MHALFFVTQCRLHLYFTLHYSVLLSPVCIVLSGNRLCCSGTSQLALRSLARDLLSRTSFFVDETTIYVTLRKQIAANREEVDEHLKDLNSLCSGFRDRKLHRLTTVVRRPTILTMH